MSFKKAIKKIAAVATGVALVGTTLAGALAVDLSNYPAPFIEDGTFNGLIVVGAKAMPADILGSIDIAAALQAASVTTVDMAGTTSSSTLSGDAVKIEAGSDILELEEDITDVLQTLDDGDLDALAGGVISTSEETTTYDQYIDLQSGSSVVFAEATNELNDDLVGDFLYYPASTAIFNYEVIYNDGFESEIEDDLLPDLEDETVYMLGNSYSVARATVDTTAKWIELELLRGDFSDTLQEGETQVYELDGVEYEVTVLAIDDGSREVMFLVNGEVSDMLEEGDTDKLGNGIEIGVRNVVVNEAGETTGGDLVEFYLGSEKITLYDDDYESETSATDGYIEINTETYDNGDGLNLHIEATELSATKFSIDSITFTLSTESGEPLYIGPGETLRDAIVAEDEDKMHVMVFDNFDILYEGLTDEQTTAFEIESSGSDKYDLTFTNVDGEEYSFQFAENDDGDTVIIGDGESRLLFPTSDNVTHFSGADIDDDDMFVINSDGAGEEDKNTVTRVIEVTDFDEDDGKVTFEDIEGGRSFTGNYNTASGLGDVKIGSKSYDFRVDLATNETIDLFDFNNDGLFWNITYDEPQIVTKGGLFVDVDFTNGLDTNANDELFADDGTPADTEVIATFTLYYGDTSIFDTSTFADTEVVEFELEVADTDGDELDLVLGTTKDLLVGDDLLDPKDIDDYEVGMDNYGTLYELKGDTNSPNDLTVTIPYDQREAQVFVIAGETTVRKKSVGGTYEIVNPLPPGFSVLDNEIRLGDANMIIVGGPCVNTIAAAVLDNPAVCTEGFEVGKARIELYNVEDTYALLVAGYGPQDTRGAAYVLADYSTYDLMGEKVEVVVTSLDDLDVNTVE